MVCLAGLAATVGDLAAEAVAVAEVTTADDVGGVETLLGAVGKVTLSLPLLQPVPARMTATVRATRLLMPHSYRIRSRHACHRTAGPRMD